MKDGGHHLIESLILWATYLQSSTVAVLLGGMRRSNRDSHPWTASALVGSARVWNNVSWFLWRHDSMSSYTHWPRWGSGHVEHRRASQCIGSVSTGCQSKSSDGFNFSKHRETGPAWTFSSDSGKAFPEICKRASTAGWSPPGPYFCSRRKGRCGLEVHWQMQTTCALFFLCYRQPWNLFHETRIAHTRSFQGKQMV